MMSIRPLEAAPAAIDASVLALIPPGHCIVVWRDASFKLNKAPKLAIVCTAGWITKRDSEALVVASEDIDATDCQRAFTAVPVCDIIAIVPTALNAPD